MYRNASRDLAHTFRKDIGLQQPASGPEAKYLSGQKSKKLLEKILTWITSAPEGQVLVIKMKTIEEPFVPYPSFVSRDILQGKEPPQVL